MDNLVANLGKFYNISKKIFLTIITTKLGGNATHFAYNV